MGLPLVNLIWNLKSTKMKTPFKRKRRFYVKVSGSYFYYTTEGYEWRMCLPHLYKNPPLYAHKFTDKEYDKIKRRLPSNHTIELAK